MSDFTPPPRGRGRHWTDDHTPTRYRRGVITTDSGFLPRLEDPTPHEPDVTTSNPGLYRVSAPGPLRLTTDVAGDHGQRADLPATPPARASAPPKGRPADLVVPRIYLEPDEVMDRLRHRALRWAVARDVTVVIVGGYLVFRWMLFPLYQSLTG